MPWVEFWVESNCAGSSGRTRQYRWYREDISAEDKDDQEELKDHAESLADEKFGHSHYGYKYGWEILEKLPEEARQRLIDNFKAQKRRAEEMLKLLKR